MRKIFILASFVIFCCFVKKATAQKQDSLKPRKQDVEILYNHYIQDGNNSAVTGGVGTEKLTVYGPSARFKSKKGRNIWDFKAGADIISSASTDNIDSIKSSASIVDTRSYVNASFARYQPLQKITWDIGMGASIESDYLSFSPTVGVSKVSADGLRTTEFQFKTYFDDLRWGRLDPEYRRPAMLIYPDELRDREWLQSYKRRSFNLNVGATQVLNKRNILGVFIFTGMQNGLLSTPFHRIYFNNDSLAVEQLPDQRLRGSLSVKLNSFVKGRTILKNTANVYADDFGILGLSLKHETAYKLSPKITVLADVKLYTQQASKYFAPFRVHAFGSTFYTSDYDLSQFQTLKLGMGLKWRPDLYKKRQRIDLISFRYHYYMRSNGLESHAISVLFKLPLKQSAKKTKRPL